MFAEPARYGSSIGQIGGFGDLLETYPRCHYQERIGVKLTKRTKKQADYLGVPVEGPYKSEHYRY